MESLSPRPDAAPGSKKRSSNEDGEMAVNRHAKRRQEKKQKDAAMEAQLASKTAEADSLRDLNDKQHQMIDETNCGNRSDMMMMLALGVRSHN